MSTKKWTDENTNTLTDAAGDVNTVITHDKVEQIAEEMEFTTRSIAAKLRKLGYTVESSTVKKASTFTEEETEALKILVEDNEGALTYADIAQEFEDGKFSPKQIQGKLLALELTSKVKPSEKAETVKKYTEQEETTFIQLAKSGKYIEDIAATLGREVASIRGKALALLSKGLIDNIPTQRESNAKTKEDVFEALGEGIAEMTVEEIAETTGKTVRGVKTALTRRGIKVVNYDGAAKSEKAAGNKSDE